MDITKHAESARMAEIYRFLAQTMRYPEKTWMVEEFFASFFHLTESLPEGLDCNSCRILLRNKKEWIGSLQTEYSRLFINAFPHVVAPPYGSMYTDIEGLGQSISLEKTEEFYRQKGFFLSDTSEPPDWLVYQLEFMAILAQADPEGLEDFLENLFRPWFVKFYKLMAQDEPHPYFMLVAGMIDFFTD